jgi:hypothetical protein
VTFTATVSPVLASGTPTGTVTFTANGVSTAAPLDAASAATFTTTALPAGTTTVTADYGGDTVFLPSAGSVDQTVNKIATTTVVVSGLNPSVAGQNVTFTATVSPSTATGAVGFTVDGGSVGNAALVAGQATYSTSALAVGAHSIIVTYGGDQTYLGSTGPALTQTVGPLLRPTITVVTSNRTPSAALGQNVTFTAAVRPATGTGIPGGSVQFNIDGSNVGGVLALNAQGRATTSTATLPAGSHNVIAVYGGSAVFAGSGSATYVQVINQAASTTLITSNANPSVFGQNVTLTARVTPSAAIGTVTFTIDGAAFGGPVPLGATGRARLVVNSLAVGTHTVSVAYGGSVNYVPSTSANLTQTVNTAASRTVVTTSGSPAAGGTTVVFTATVTARAPGVGVPAGGVQFRIDGVDVGVPVTLNPSGQAAYATSTLPVGRHSVSAVYAGNGDFSASTSAGINQRIR